MPSKWNNEYLDQMRKVGDEEADKIVEALIASKQLESSNHLLDTLVRSDMRPSDRLPHELIDYLNKSDTVSAEDLKAIKKGQRLFSRHGHLILLILVCGSLPTSYAVPKGVKVLKGTKRLQNRPNRRLWETAQMVVNIMGPGGLSPQGRGVRTAQKVRLMHAAIRHVVLSESNPAWDIDTFGRPVNQEDMAGTLQLFSTFVMDGLENLGLWIDPEEKVGYFRAWQVVGRIMGVHPDLIPATPEEAAELNALIWTRQKGPSQDGRDMLAALLSFLKKDSPWPIKWAPGATIRYLLPLGAADMIGVPKHRVGLRAVGLVAKINQLLNKALGPSRISSMFFRRLGLRVVKWLIKVDRGGERAQFHIPAHLRTYWGAPSAAEEKTFWQRWLDQLLNMRRAVTRVMSSYVTGSH